MNALLLIYSYKIYGSEDGDYTATLSTTFAETARFQTGSHEFLFLCSLSR
jgi:hypothetical protein